MKNAMRARRHQRLRLLIGGHLPLGDALQTIHTKVTSEEKPMPISTDDPVITLEVGEVLLFQIIPPKG
jgi:hypothetical protein